MWNKENWPLDCEGAYALGAHEVIVQWADDFTTREKFLHAPMDRLDNVPDYKIAEMNYLLEHKASRLGVRSSDPGALNGVDAEKLSASAKALGMAMNQCASQLNPTRSAGPLLQQQV